jgi:Tol biopolymer transport system component
MSSQYGPWASSIDAGGNPELSTFWRRRLTRLASTSESSPVISRRSVLCLGAAGAAAVLLPTLRAATAEEQKPSANGQKSPSGRIYFQGSGTTKDNGEKPCGIHAIDPDTGGCELLIDNGGGFRVSRDGKSLAFDKSTFGGTTTNVNEIWTYDLATGATARVLDDGREVFPSAKGEHIAKRKLFSGHPIWSPDDKQIIASVCLWGEGRNAPTKHATRIVNRDGSGVKRLAIPETDTVEDWSPDGKWLVAMSYRDDGPGIGGQLYRMRPDGSDQLRLTKEGRNCMPRFSPDGRRIVYHRDYWMSGRYVFEVRVMDVDGANDHVVVQNEGMNNLQEAVWSPDGRRLAVIWYTELLDNGTRVRKLGEESKHRVEIMDADGKNRREVKLANAVPRYMCELDWR